MDFETEVNKIVDQLSDEVDIYMGFGHLRVENADAQKNYIRLSCDCDFITFNALKKLSEVFGTNNVNFTGESKTTYPYSEYTPIPVFKGTLFIQDSQLAGR